MQGEELKLGELDRASNQMELSNAKTNHNFHLDGGLGLRVQVQKKKGNPSVCCLEFQVPSVTTVLLLHWGVIFHPTNKQWSIPSNLPPGSRYYGQKALQTPFKRYGESSSLIIEILDPKICAIEFVLKEEGKDRWFKLNGQNIHIDIPRDDTNVPNIFVPEDLVRIKAYLRWESKGKRAYTPQQEKEEYEEARRELQELLKGISVAELRKKLESAGSKVKDDTKRENIHTLQHMPRKKWDPSNLLNKYPDRMSETKISGMFEKSNASHLHAYAMEGLNDGVFLQKLTFKLGDKQILVYIIKNGDEIFARLVTDIKEPTILHWGLLKNSTQEWLVPSPNIRPEGSKVLDGACETPFKKGFAGHASIQFLDLKLAKSDSIGMAFVLRCDGQWIKNNGSDFYVSLKAADGGNGKSVGDGKGTVKWLLDAIAERERDAERSLMHRFSIATELTEKARSEGKLVLAGIFVWMRFMATRQLTWNKNYNVKPREISAAQDKFTNLLQRIYQDQPHNRELVRLVMLAVGRGGEGDLGQRIRDEILVIQRNNNCMGGMMEEWHQKLHNNTSPDDVVICQALLDYIKGDFKIDIYWKTLNTNGVTKKRLASYDRPIFSEPSFRRDQKEGLVRDLTAYMTILKAIHSGADLESAIANCIGYKTQVHDFASGIQVHPISGLSPELPGLLKYVIEHVEDKNVVLLLKALVESRLELRPCLLQPYERLKDLIFLDLALESTVRTAVERGYEELKNASPLDIIHFIVLVLENLCLSSDNNEEFVYCLKDWCRIEDLFKSSNDQCILYAVSVLDRTRLALIDKAENYQRVLQPSAEYLGTLLGVNQWAINIFTEEVIRSGSSAPLSLLLNDLYPVFRNMANLGCWQIISPVEVRGYVSTVDELLKVQNRVYNRPTILLARRVKGEEEIPDGAVAVLTMDMPDVLSHVSVRARNSKVCFATCFDQNVFNNLKLKEGKALLIRPTSSDLMCLEIEGSDVLCATDMLSQNVMSTAISLKKKRFNGTYAISAEEFTSELVGSKSCNLAYLRGKVASWVKVPVSVALPFGVFEKVLTENMNKDVAHKITASNNLISKGDYSKLSDVRQAVLQLKAPIQLINRLKSVMQGSKIPWPGDEGEQRWQQAWMAIKKVWASKWNERAYFSTKKAKVDHNELCMAVLIQEIINADYAFVIHTTNPVSGNTSEIYAEIVKGLGETLVGAYPGRAMSFVTNKSALLLPKIIGYPSKQVGLFIKKSIIFRSDSNGEDLEGYAGAGLYDSVPMDEEEKLVINYSVDRLIVDQNFQRSILSKIAQAGKEIEQLYKCAQDIEGVIKDGELYVVQTRPQM